MKVAIQDRFKRGYDETTCYYNICVARAVFESKSTTREEYSVMVNVLGFMFFNGPVEINDVILATLQEAILRQNYFECIWRKI